MMIHAELDWNKLDLVRRQGEVSNYNDMHLEINPTINAVTI
jgi:hypothetical protein